MDLDRRRGTDEVTLNDAYLEGFDIDAIRPEPQSESRAHGRTVYSFKGGSPRTVKLSLMPREVGFQRGRMRCP